MNKLTTKFLKLCKKAGYKRIAIGVKDRYIREFRNWPFGYENNVFASPDIRDEDGFMKIWDIVEKLGVWNGCGNGQQAQIKPNKLNPGSYSLKDVKKKQPMGQKRKLVMIVERCYECHYHNETGGIAGSAEWCCHPKVNKDKSKQIYGEDLSLDFPKWCPLPS